MVLKMRRLAFGLFIAAILLLFACQAPERILQSVRKSGSVTPASTAYSLTLSPVIAGKNTATPVYVATATRSQSSLTEQPAYPGGETPGITSSTQPVSPVMSPSSTFEALATAETPSDTASATVNVQEGTQAAYIAPESGLQPTLPVENGYPGPFGPSSTGSQGSYPAPGAPASGNSPTPQTQSPTTPTASVTLQQSATATQTSSPMNGQLSGSPVVGVTQMTPTFTPSPSPTVSIPTETPTLTYSPPTETPLPTPTPTRTPFLTPTSTITLTPTPTRTPLPAPAWVSVKLRATDPRTVQLVAGKPQLIEFFAYWSGASLAMAPVVQGVEKEYSRNVNFIYLDIDNPATNLFKQQLRYKTAPHFFLVNAQGKVLQQWVGYVTVEQFRQALEAALP